MSAPPTPGTPEDIARALELLAASAERFAKDAERGDGSRYDFAAGVYQTARRLRRMATEAIDLERSFDTSEVTGEGFGTEVARDWKLTADSIKLYAQVGKNADQLGLQLMQLARRITELERDLAEAEGDLTHAGTLYASSCRRAAERIRSGRRFT